MFGSLPIVVIAQDAGGGVVRDCRDAAEPLREAGHVALEAVLRQRILIGMVSSLFPATRWSLVGRSADGTSDRALLLDHYADAIGRYLAHRFPDLLRRGVVDDLVQEVLLGLLRNGEVLRRADPGHGGRFRYFLMRVAYNAARNARRRLSRRDWSLIADEAVAETVGAGDPLPEAAMDRAWAMSVLRRAWTDLRAWAAEGAVSATGVDLLERQLAGTSLRQAAEDLGVSLGTAHRHMAKARHLLRRAVIAHLRFAGDCEVDEADEDRAYRLLIDAARL